MQYYCTAKYPAQGDSCSQKVRVQSWGDMSIAPVKGCRLQSCKESGFPLANLLAGAILFNSVQAALTAASPSRSKRFKLIKPPAPEAKSICTHPYLEASLHVSHGIACSLSLPQGYRFAMPHSILMMHHPSGASRGQASEMHIEARELVRMRDYLSLLVSDSTGQPYDRVRSLASCRVHVSLQSAGSKISCLLQSA